MQFDQFLYFQIHYHFTSVKYHEDHICNSQETRGERERRSMQMMVNLLYFRAELADVDYQVILAVFARTAAPRAAKIYSIRQYYSRAMIYHSVPVT